MSFYIVQFLWAITICYLGSKRASIKVLATYNSPRQRIYAQLTIQERHYAEEHNLIKQFLPEIYSLRKRVNTQVMSEQLMKKRIKAPLGLRLKFGSRLVLLIIDKSVVCRRFHNHIDNQCRIRLKITLKPHRNT